jgi:hypothetical protein
MSLSILSPKLAILRLISELVNLVFRNPHWDGMWRLRNNLNHLSKHIGIIAETRCLDGLVQIFVVKTQARCKRFDDEFSNSELARPRRLD